MPVHHENRSGNDRRKFNMSSVTTIARERRWNRDRRRTVANEEELYDTEWELSEADLEPGANLAVGLGD